MTEVALRFIDGLNAYSAERKENLDQPSAPAVAR